MPNLTSVVGSPYDDEASEVDRHDAAELARRLKGDAPAWNDFAWERERRFMGRADPLFINGQDLSGTDLTQRLIYNVQLKGSTLDQVDVPTTLLIKSLSHIAGVQGVLTLTQGNHVLAGKNYNFATGVILVNAKHRPMAFHIPTRRPPSPERGPALPPFELNFAELTLAFAALRDGKDLPKAGPTYSGILARLPYVMEETDQCTRSGIKAAIEVAGWTWSTGVVAERPSRRRPPVDPSCVVA